MKNKKVGIFLLLLIIICQTAGCASSGNGQMKYNKKEDYWTDDREIETDVEIADLDTDMKSTIEGDWYVFDSVKRNGKYYTLDGVLCRKAEFPNVKSMSLALGAETIEDCLCNYYANWVGALSIGFLEQVYGIYDGDIITVQQEIEEAELDFSRVDYENLSIENIVDVSIEDVVWDFYSDCPLEEVKYVTYSHDTDTGIQTSAVYMGKTYGLWSILWTSGEIN